MQRTDLQTSESTSSNLLHEGVVDLGRASPLGADGSGSASLPVPGQLEPYFDPRTVVSLDTNGQPLSRYEDRKWDLSAMSTDGGQTTCNLHFFEAQPGSVPAEVSRINLAGLIREQQKALLWLYMDAGPPRAQKTSVTACHALTQLARGAYRRGATLFDLFCDPEQLGEESEGLNPAYAKSTRALLKTLWRHRDALKVDLEVQLKKLVAVSREAARQMEPEGNQTPIMPSRIYCATLAALLGWADEIERGLDTLLNAFRQERAATAARPQGLTDKQFQIYRDKQLDDVRKDMRARGWRKGSMREFIAGEISAIQLKLMHIVIAFTGMRVSEVQILPLDGVLEEVEHKGAVHYVVNGYSHKLNGGRKKAVGWVTSREGRRAILLAQRISITVLDVLEGNDAARADRGLLFSSLSNPYRKKNIQRLYTGTQEQVMPEIGAVITQADIDELNAMELERSWLRDGIEVGKLWPLTFHQYRRSLSVYAHRSGMVSLPALKGQLQHITDEMRAYYGDGFCRAINLVFDKDHFSHEWSAAKSESSFLAYSMALLFSDENLIGEVSGRGAARMQQTVSSRSRKDTLDLFRDGKLAYRETVLGGCTSLEACDHTPLEPIPWDCLEKDCANAVVFGKRLELLIKTQEVVVASLAQGEEGSVEHRLEADHLRVLLKTRQRLEEAA